MKIPTRAQIRSWYEERTQRERLFTMALSWTFQYILFTVFILNPLENKQVQIENELKNINNMTNSWKSQITALNTITASGLYKEWQQHRKDFLSLKNKSAMLLQTKPSSHWIDVVKNLLISQQNVSLVQIKHLPENIYTGTEKTDTKTGIYRQQLQLNLMSDYFATVNYLQKLEKAFPQLHWDKLNYEVQEYPIAKIELECSVFYEKH